MVATNVNTSSNTVNKRRPRIETLDSSDDDVENVTVIEQGQPSKVEQKQAIKKTIKKQKPKPETDTETDTDEESEAPTKASKAQPKKTITKQKPKKPDSESDEETDEESESESEAPKKQTKPEQKKLTKKEKIDTVFKKYWDFYDTSKSCYGNNEVVEYKQSTLNKLIQADYNNITAYLTTLNELDNDLKMLMDKVFTKKHVTEKEKVEKMIDRVKSEIAMLVTPKSTQVPDHALHKSLDYAFKSIKKLEGTTTYISFFRGRWNEYDSGDKMKCSLMNSIKVRNGAWVKLFEDGLSEHEVVVEFVPETTLINHNENKVNIYIESPFKRIYKDVTPDNTMLDVFNEYIFDVCARGDKQLGNFLIKWIANVVRGKKNNTFISMVSTQEGIGKSMFGEIIGAMLSESMIYSFNIIELAKWTINLKNKVLLVLDETGSKDNNLDCVANLKKIITSGTFSFEGKRSNLDPTKTTGNIVMSSNYPITFADDNNGRRACNVKLSDMWGKSSTDTEEQRNEKKRKWSTLCKTNITGYKALYDYLMTIDVTNFNSQDELKLIKDDTIIEEVTLASPFQFIKDEFILKKDNDGNIIKNGMANIVNTDLYAQFEIFKNTRKLGHFSRKGFYETLSDINISSSVGAGNKKYYKYSYEQLRNIFISKNYLTYAEKHEDDGGGDQCEEPVKPRSVSDIINSLSDREMVLLEEYFRNK